MDRAKTGLPADGEPPRAVSWAYRRWQARRWAYDHGAHWTEQIGDMLARPWMRLSRWCYHRWLEMR